MTFTELFQISVKELVRQKIPFVVGGVLIASIYRLEKRAMMSVQLIVDSEPKEMLFLEGLLLAKPFEMILPDSNLPRHVTPIDSISQVKKVLFLEVSEDPRLGLEIVFHNLPWIPEAIERAQYNRLDFGFALLPALTVEDIIVAKLYSSTQSSDRYLDLDDLQNIFQANHDLDLGYITNQINKLSLGFHKSLWEYAPEGLRRIGRSTGKHFL